MPADFTILTIGGEDKLACRAAEVRIGGPDRAKRPYGYLSWLFGRAVLNTAPDSNWIGVLGEMVQLMGQQGIVQPLQFHGEVTRPVTELS